MMAAARIALGSTIILIFAILMPFLVCGADLPAGTKDGGRMGTEICFPLSDGERILHVLESYSACQEVVRAGEEAMGGCEARSQTLEGRVVEQDRELQEARKLVDDTRKAGEEAAKAAAPPWYQRVLNAGKWIGLGVLVGFVAGAGK